MFLIFLLPSLIFSTLNKGDNPYKILGVPRNANKDQIRRAFLKFTKSHHPDIDKSPDAERKFMRASDAYEILNDDKQRRIFDETGSVSMDPNEGFGDFGDIFSSFHGEKLELNVERVDLSSIDHILNEHGDCFVIVFDRNNQPFSLSVALQMFNIVVDQYQDLCKFVANDAADDNGSFKDHYCRTGSYTLLYLKKSPSGQIMSFSSGANLYSVTDITSFMELCWNPKVKVFKSYKKAKQWIKDSGKEHTRILMLEKRKNFVKMEIKRASNLFGNKCRFAVLNDDFVSMIRDLNLTVFPAFLAFRGENEMTILRSLSEKELEDVISPLFFKIDRHSLIHECENFCVAKVGKPTDDDFKEFSQMKDFPLGYLEENSKLAQAIGVKKGEFVIIEGSRKRYSVVKNKNTIFADVAKRNINKLQMKLFPEGVDGDWTIRIILYYFDIYKIRIILMIKSMYSVLWFIFNILSNIPPPIIILGFFLLKMLFKVLLKFFCCCCCCRCCR